MSERQPRNYDFATRDLAMQAYIYRGQTYEEIAAETGISVSQLKRWGDKEDWKGQKAQYLKEKSRSLTRLIKARSAMLDKLDQEINPSTVHQLLSAYRQLDTLIEGQITGRHEPDRAAIFLDDLRFIVEELAKTDPTGVAIIDKNFDSLIEAFKDKETPPS
jgi:transposase-like protein